jgi:hypothetical protein
VTRRAFAAVATAAILVFATIAGAQAQTKQHPHPVLNLDGKRRGASIPLHGVNGIADPGPSSHIGDVFPDGKIVYAREQYVLNGALPNELYQVQIAIFIGNPECEGTATFVQPSSFLQTNGAGNATARVLVGTPGNGANPEQPGNNPNPDHPELPSPIPPGVTNMTQGFIWQIRHVESGVVHYETNCTAAFEDSRFVP